MSKMAMLRLKKEYKMMCQDGARSPDTGFVAEPSAENIFEWHFVIFGSGTTDFRGGEYCGVIQFKHNYPFAPPSIRMLTPSGRFDPGKRICFSMSDFHPESWQSSWSVSTILLGVQSFMHSDEMSTGCVRSDGAERVQLARESVRFNRTRGAQFVHSFVKSKRGANRLGALRLRFAEFQRQEDEAWAQRRRRDNADKSSGARSLAVLAAIVVLIVALMALQRSNNDTAQPCEFCNTLALGR
jgi:ubiquitin-conjugating enzyme E2 J2